MAPLTTARPLRPAARLLAVLAVLGSLLALQLGVLRPWYLRWGATDAELAAALPGDELWPDPLFQETRAITVHAPPAAVWAWIAQLGQDKGGFYSYALLERMVGADIRNADRLLGLPDPKAGDRIWMAPPTAFGGTAWGLLGRVEPGRAMVMLGHDGMDPTPVGTWAFVLEPAPGGTRLLVRGRAYREGATGWAARAGRVLLFEPAHFVMERRMLLGIAERAEGRPPAVVSLVVEPLSWLACLAVALLAGGAGLLRARPGPALRLFAAAGLALALLPLLAPPLAITVASPILLAWALPWAFGRGTRPRTVGFPDR